MNACSMRPRCVVVLVIVLLAIHAALNWAPDAIQDRVVRDFAFIPGRLTIAIWPQRLIDLLDRANSDPTALEQVREIRELRVLGGGAKPWTLLTYAFLHGSWTHVLLNTVWLVAFGPPIARRFGSCEVPRVHGRDCDRQRAGALGERADGFLPAHRSVGGGFRSHGRSDALHVSAWGAAWRVRLRSTSPRSKSIRP